MYSWGDDTSTWNNPGKYDYGSAKKPYLDDLAKKAEAEGPRSYSSKKGPDMKLVGPEGKNLQSLSENVVLLAVDGTGSMQKWPAEIFDRLPLLYQTLSKYRDDVEISFSVIGDAKWDKWPTQVGDIEKGVSLDKYLKALHAEGGGGPGNRESYELWAYFVKEHVDVPKAVSPTLIIMGDEKFYEQISAEQVKKVFGDTIQGPIDAMTVWKDIAAKYDVYLLHKEHPGDDDEVLAQWREAIGDQKVVPVYDPLRVVDQAMAIVAEKWGCLSDFEKNLAARQDKKTVNAVMTSLKGVSIPGAKAAGGEKSVKSKSILEG